MTDVPLHLAPGEPEAGPWRLDRLADVAASLIRLARSRGAGQRPAVLAVDGRSSGSQLCHHDD
jgi:hypothetical protein